LTYIVGISGGSASGKTTFIHKLKQVYQATQISVLSQDNYYKPLHSQKKNAFGDVNFDEPDSINLELYQRDILSLITGKSILVNEYTFNNTFKNPQMIKVEPTPILILEGLFISELFLKAIRIDLKLFIETENHLKLKRRLIRDTSERGMTDLEVLNQWEKYVIPSYNKYLIPQKKEADIILSNNIDFEFGFNLVLEKLNQRVNL
jgi:uridine kinase